ncbi:hypothetical protein FH972_025608 [Carpinus fangiana]|uniref:PPM-type phosphatase domain-containing protein n=1 Tax=Carpinus fangiana TaxID=176857 RepID=A0A5N6L1S4_9ROSI|nr:hypothetical protein FH972_025608 [Carpinus fangiana]
MRRAAVQVLRSARRPVVRSSHRSRTSQTPTSSHVLNSRALHTRRDLQLVPSSMYFRNFSVALVSTIVASGAYFAYRGGPQSGASVDLAHQQAKGFTTSSIYSSGPAATSLVEDAAEATRRALVIDRGQLYTADLPGNGVLQKDTDDYGRKIMAMTTPEQATERLRRNEQSFLVGRGKGVVRYDLVQLASNDPIEDDHAEKIVEVPQTITPPAEGETSNDWMFWGVFDGHSGWVTSSKLRQALISFVARELNTTYTNAQSSAQSLLPSPNAIDEAIKRGFLALDHSIVQQSVADALKTQSKAKAASLLAPALSGSCALLSFYDSASKNLRVACTGDSRAVLGRRSSTDPSKWVATPLSTDQTGGNEEEAERLRREHPGEPNVVRNGRVLGGLEPSRAFGDATYKWSKEIQDKMKREYFGRSANPAIRSPPYVTAEPVVTTTQVQPDKGDFVVMATDGLWEMLTNDEVVGLVGQWLEKHPEAQLSRTPRAASDKSSEQQRADSWLKSWWSSGQSAQLPVAQHADAHDVGGQRAPIRQQQWGISNEKGGASSSRFVCEDKNAATHLIRNALGGADRDMVCTLLTLPSPYSRRYRDDLTVEVIFFGDGADEGSGGDRIVVNQEATAQNQTRSKL